MELPYTILHESTVVHVDQLFQWIISWIAHHFIHKVVYTTSTPIGVEEMGMVGSHEVV